MQKISTQNDLVKYIYNESTTKESNEVEQFLIEDVEFQNIYFNLLEVKVKIENIKCSPRENTIQNILAFSKSIEVKKSNGLPTISFVKN